jgi:hypothetical protein
MLALVDAKREEFMEELDIVDARDLMDPETTKWTHISDRVMAAGFSPCLRDHAMYKSKWHLIIPDYRRIVDHHARIGTNGQVYWSQTNQEHVQEGLPKSFFNELFDRIDEWFGGRPQMQPSHIRDLMNPRDKNFDGNKDLSEDNVEVVGDTGEEDSINPDLDYMPCTQPRMNAGCGKGMSLSVGMAKGSPLPHCPTVHLSGGSESAVPPKPSPILLSSSESGSYNMKRRLGNTRIRRRTSALADATKAIGDVMVAQMKEMVGATRETEHNRLEVQLRLFSENMQYQREKK